MSTTDKLSWASATLAQTNRLAVEAEEIANETLTELRNQREKIRGVQNKTEQIDSELSIASKRIDNMNKCCIT
jgi:septal ring factor EnvC (AmiA/AmiB activator)